MIKDISSRRFVTKLILGHNNLGDEGCEALFNYLCSEEGRKYKLAEISLNSNGIGNQGLMAVAEYLKNNTHLRVLFLQSVSCCYMNISQTVIPTFSRRIGLLEMLELPRPSQPH